jgi:hypothetical protein
MRNRVPHQLDGNRLQLLNHAPRQQIEVFQLKGNMDLFALI